MAAIGWLLFFLLVVMTFLFQRASRQVWWIGLGCCLLAWSLLGAAVPISKMIVWVLVAAFFIPITVPFVRRHLISARFIEFYRKRLPAMSRTEREALLVGSVGWEEALFSGKPNWQTCLNIPLGQLTQEEQDFLNGSVTQLCAQLDNWKINHEWRKVPDEVVAFLKKEGFFGLIIPKSYGGLGFSATAHSTIIAKIASTSTAVAVLASVPNSLGPAELLLHYGTEEQKNYYLPRLAKGEEIPCFGLTSPLAGSDAGALEDHGVVAYREINGEKTLGIVLNWSKRYITLAPIATLVGLAFKLYDPEHLLGDKKSYGITVALVPAKTPGVVIGRRHYPLCSSFPNGPTQGHDVFIPMNQIIGGVERVGQGWSMLMECLAAGRSISLPAISTGCAKRAAFASGAYARIRWQFNTYIGSFGGVEEALAKINANTLLMDAIRRFTLSQVDQGIHSAVSSAICKYQTTELGRAGSAYAMDLHGGKGICMGPNNYLAQNYIEAPISITVEGANILTRSMIIFGQGAIRAHPYLLKTMQAVEQNNLKAFDDHLWSHVYMILSNWTRSRILGVTNGRMASVPNGPLTPYYRRLARLSSAFAWLSDTTLILLGAKLKRMEHLSGRLADILCGLYMGSAVLHLYQHALTDYFLPWAEWTLQSLTYQVEEQLSAFIANFPASKWMKFVLRRGVFPLGRLYSPPSDDLTAQVARMNMEASPFRDYLAEYCDVENRPNNPVGQLGDALNYIVQTELLFKKLEKGIREKHLDGKTFEEKIALGVAEGLLEPQEAEHVREAYRRRMAVIQVDDFEPSELECVQ